MKCCEYGPWIQCHYAECGHLFFFMLSVILLSVIKLNVVAPLKICNGILKNSYDRRKIIFRTRGQYYKKILRS
jgi:hypothetical protein